MRPQSVSLVVLFLATFMLAACANESAAPEPVMEGDAEFDDFVEREMGKADANGVEEHSFDGICVLKLVNTAPENVIKDDVFFSALGIRNILARRAGPDKIWGTTDDVGFSNLEDLDDVPFVGRITFGHLKSRATERGYCPKLGEEFVMPGEEEATEAIVARSERFVEENFQNNDLAHRDAHAKAHGCVTASFEVDNSGLLPEERIGVFATNRSYPTWIRFSNGSFHIDDDTGLEIRGMALKLMEVEGDKVLEDEKSEMTQDFLLINGSTMFVRNPVDYVDLSEKAFDGNPVSYFLSLDPRKWRLRELVNLLRTTTKKPSSPLSSRYWSTTPYRLGENAVKYSARPCDGESSGRPDGAGENYMREEMRKDLAENDACFEFMIQRQNDPRKMPIEDPTYEWDEDDSPFIPVARLHISKQDFTSTERDTFCENLSFTPWHTLPEHTPMGGVNRVRLKVYNSISSLRHLLGEQERVEPTTLDVP